MERQIDLKDAARAIEIVAAKAALLIKARRLNLTEAQMRVYRKVVNNEMTGCWEWSSVEALKRRGLIIENKCRGNLDCHYMAVQ